MEYSETVCVICGVSFNISRFRTIREPLDFAWMNTGDGIFDVVSEFSCSAKDGCVYFRRNYGEEVVEQDNEGGRYDDHHDHPHNGDNYDSDFDDQLIPPSRRLYCDAYERCEHIAGLRCKSNQAYHGDRISKQAMEGCNLVQCLVRKSSDQMSHRWTPEQHDQSFERSSSVFLSSVSQHMPSLDLEDPNPDFGERHGWDGPVGIIGFDASTQSSIPFHPTCFEIFKRASLHRKNFVDAEGLFDCVEYEILNDWRFPRHPAVEKVLNSWWSHHRGDEFLAANPCVMPMLNSIHNYAVFSNNNPIIWPVFKPEGQDFLSRLPEELRFSILTDLSSKDIANLRLTSRTFRHLPQALYHHLILRESPWLYEAWTSIPLSPWSTWNSSIPVPRWSKWDDKPAAIESSHDVAHFNPSGFGAKYTQAAWKYEEVDWKYLLMRLGQERHEMLGLQNRRKIWNDCVEILERIDLYREQGKFVSEET